MKSKIKCVIFDLDGTLVNTIIDLGRTCDYLLKNKGIKPQWTQDDYKSFVGNGAKLLVDRAFGGNLSPRELEEQYAIFKEKYNEIKMDNTYVYDGIIETVSAIKSAGIKTAVCTNKPDLAAKGMIYALFGKNCFDIVLGATDNVPKKPDTAMPAQILSELNVTAEECVWIGDSSVDIETAKNLGCQCIAVSWGFRPEKSLRELNPDMVVNSPKEILNFFEISIDI